MKSFFLLLSTLLSTFTFSAEVADISARQLLSSDSSEWLILDVRSAEEYAMGHVPGAINISHVDIEQNLQQLSAYKDKTVVLYCRSGKRAAIATNTLLEHDFSQLKHLQGDMNGWQQDGLAIEK